MISGEGSGCAIMGCCFYHRKRRFSDSETYPYAALVLISFMYFVVLSLLFILRTVHVFASVLVTAIILALRPHILEYII